MNFVLPSLGNTTENITLSDKWASNYDENSGATALAVLASFVAMVLGAACMLCFVGKLLSTWYHVDVPLHTNDTPATKYSEVGSQQPSQNNSGNLDESDCDRGQSMVMKPIGSNLPKG